jgi:UPF0271 protein
MKLRVDLNADVGESFGPYTLGNDAELLPYVSSANIACGFHAGDPGIMRRTLQLCHQHGVAVGAHPGLPDVAGFGRREMQLSPQEVYDLVVYQLGALQAFATAEGVRVQHVKPHGALYNMAAADAPLARAVAAAVYRVDRQLVLFGSTGSELITAGEEIGLAVANEVFADRTYQATGALTPRSMPDAMIADARVAAERVLRMVRSGRVVSQQGTELTVRADTVCLHGDAPQAVLFAETLRRTLLAAGVEIMPPQRSGDA